jgi:hypothetical protein
VLVTLAEYEFFTIIIIITSGTVSYLEQKLIRALSNLGCREFEDPVIAL